MAEARPAREAVDAAGRGDAPRREGRTRSEGPLQPGQEGAVSDEDLLRFVGGALPAPHARVIEVGAGGGELAAELRALGYDVLAIDPAADSTPGVEPTALADVDRPAASFDAAVAIRSLHHVEPLAESIARLAELVRPGGRLVVDEYDVERFDERAAQWLMERREVHATEPAAMVAEP